MDRTELAERIEEVDADTPYYELLILDYDDPRNVWWACNCCGEEIPDNLGCRQHAPRNIPGLAQTECEADPPHAPRWVLNGEHTGYGIPCPDCVYSGVAESLARANRCRHWPWRRWRVTKWAARWAYRLGVVAGYSTGTADGCNWCIRSRRWRGQRPYILGASRDTWRCWLVGRHRRGEEVGFGFCGKCVPWFCCGSIRVEHEDGCAEDAPNGRVAVPA